MSDGAAGSLDEPADRPVDPPIAVIVSGRSGSMGRDDAAGPSSTPHAVRRGEPATVEFTGLGLKEGLRAMGRAPVVLCVALIRVYQRVISPMLGDVCRYHPSCSRYAVGAISTHGVFKGCVLAARRLLRCTPLHAGGLDPVPPRGAWKPRIEPDGRVRA